MRAESDGGRGARASSPVPVPSKDTPATPDSGARASSPVPGEAEGQWRSRGYLPHFDLPNAIQSVTFRLADALPSQETAELHEMMRGADSSAWRHELDSYLDAGHGSCSLKNPQIAEIVESALLYFDGIRYRLIAWVVMPNHVHVVMETLPGFPLSGILHTWKSFTARKANEMLGLSGAFWQPEYFDRLVRNERHSRNLVDYIHANPARAGLVLEPRCWSYSSVSRWEDEPGTGEDARAPQSGSNPMSSPRRVETAEAIPAVGLADSTSGANQL